MNEPDAAKRQVGALCWRRGADGGLEILLITSRGTGRWVIPKGNRMKGLSDAEAAAEEAREEAGVAGVPAAKPIGSFAYDKRLSGGRSRPAVVEVYCLRVEALADAWPEQAERTRRWFPPAEAARLVDEPELKALIESFDPNNPLPEGERRAPSR